MFRSTCYWLSASGLLLAAACGSTDGDAPNDSGGAAGLAASAGALGVSGSSNGTSGASGSSATAGQGGSTSGGSAGEPATGGVAGSTAGTAGTAGTAADPSAGAGGGTLGGGNGFYRMERLNRGVVAVQSTGGVFVSWRMFGYEYDAVTPSNVSYDVYRDGAKIANVTDSTNYLDAAGKSNSSYTVRPVIAGVAGATSEAATVLPQQYLRVPLQVPAGGSTPAACANAGEAYTYVANDGSPGDLDGDGDYEIVLKWDPSNSKDNSQDGCTGNVYLDAYQLDGKRLWRIDLGPNIRGGAHYTQFVVADFDGDGKAEMAVKTAPGTKDGKGVLLHTGPAANDDDGASYRNSAGRVLTGPEYLTVFDGATGAELSTVDFDQARGTVSAWGDSYGNRVDRFLATAGYLDGTGLPSFVMARGYYTRATLSAWNYRDKKLTRLWKFDSNVTPKDAAGHPYTGQGSHSMTVANVDDDKGQEIMYGAAAIDDDGKGLCSTGFGHGDAEHVGDLVPSRPGLEFFMCNEDGAHPAYHLRDAKTCAILQQGPVNGADTGRCVAEDVDAANPGGEMWSSSTDGLISATSNARLGSAPGSQNFLLWWDGDETRELEDATRIDKYENGATKRLLTATGVSSNNGTKSTPTLSADLLGDWREEVVWRESDNSALRIYTTTALTKRRLFTLMHDPQYRMQVSGEQTAYNQPPHVSFHLGAGMKAPPPPDIHVK